jgi:hypothetical protein
MNARGSRQSSSKPVKPSPARNLPLWSYLQPLVNFYNLHLDGFNEADKKGEKVDEYLKKYVPPDAQPNSEWFHTNGFKNFVILWRDIRILLDAYIEQKVQGQHLAKLGNYLKRHRPLLVLKHRKDGSLRGFYENLEEVIDLTQWEPSWGEGIIDTAESAADYDLLIGPLIAKLIFGVYRIYKHQVRVIRCQRRRCRNIFIPKPRAPSTGKAPKYCPRCRSKRKN